MKKAAIIFLSVLALLLCRVCDHPAMATEAAAQAEHSGEGAEHGEGIGQTVGRWINFAALAAILYLFLKKGLKVQDAFKADAEQIKHAIESARLAKEEAEQRLGEMDQQMAGLTAEIAKIRAEAVEDAEEEKKRILESASKEAERLVELAHREIDAEVRNAKKELRKQVAESAVVQGRTIIEREIKDTDHERLIADYIEGFGK